ncbi:MAG: cardiolipin synthase B, partial [Pseudomonas sp.]|uniref:phospholipase D-like domain-containing protein n=1 Tax=Pseudomonas sp. TaxID=306 RepID=UPI001220718E
MSQVLEPAILEGNSVQALVNGDQIFPAMLSAIRAAQKTITLETYIYWSGDVGQQFAQALKERARQGVKINILIDWYGSEINENFLEQMRNGGVVIHKYNPPTWTTLDKVNHRTHRRLLIVDGVVGFIGGAGLSEKWSGHAQGPDHWRDTHFKIEGPA